MGLERGLYFTRSRKVSGRVVREYIGSRPLAEARIALDAALRADRAALRAADRRRSRRMLDADKAAASRFAADMDAVAGLLAAAGYRRHNRGEWRRSRVPNLTDDQRRDAGRELTAALERHHAGGKKGAAKPIQELSRLLLLDRAGGDPMLPSDGRLARAAALGSDRGEDLVSARAEELRWELAGERPSAVARLAADAAVSAWLFLAKLEAEREACGHLDTERQLLTRTRCIDSAHRRYMRALKTLAQVQRLRLPAVQINVAREQVNLTLGGAEPVASEELR